jgi:dipeptidase E
MKLLLTSNGLSNQSIASTLFDMVGKKPSETTIAFVPTAMDIDEGDKGWFVDYLVNIKKQGLKYLDIVDIAALSADIFLPRFEAADVLFFSGGNTAFLRYWLARSGLEERLPNLLEARVYAGISAGSMVTAPTLFLSSADKRMYYEESFDDKNNNGLGLVDLYVRVHLNSPCFPEARAENIKEWACNVQTPVYAIDDESAVSVVDDQVHVVGEGESKVFNKMSSI